MKNDINDILAEIEAAQSAGQALDAIPESWRNFIMGPDGAGEFSAALTPGKEFPMATRVYDNGFAMGRGPDRLTAIQKAVEWLRERTPELNNG